MLQIEKHVFVSDLDEAYTLLLADPTSMVLGGCGYLRLGNRKIGTAIDLTRLGLNRITRTKNVIEIGAMTSLRDLETDPHINSLAGGMLGRSVAHIVGVQFRRGATIGGSVAGRFAFSDPVTALMALDAELVFHHHGRMMLKDYLEGRGVRDILTRIVLSTACINGAFVSVRRSATDYAVLNVAAARRKKRFRIAVGSRPGRAVFADGAADHIQRYGLSEKTAGEAGTIAAGEVPLGDNPRGSGLYRKKICPVLVARALMQLQHTREPEEENDAD
ncbi:FAD binding domain-containing protein [Desulforhopalus singaporensis]|uniref:CO or xanthine dehydrogenase, FAD-binding subunit n=1 Tax=Desulforhopalus singaporensis TaxID=91360 RepID=A0A1H0K1A2_9BACT|nr:FAD binding domain-containing protein [Desulforhopalus singaporensis]SDO49543.1 CO or xanthine dehydrogenase, FAD-binding subunit [Desulforhopalus singaporensis]